MATFSCTIRTQIDVAPKPVEKDNKFVGQSIKKHYNKRDGFLTWGKGLYYHLNRTGKSLRKYPNGEDPLKQELFGKTRRCTKCKKRKSTLKFHWKTDYTNYKDKVTKRLQRFCGACRVKHDNDKYSASADAYLRRRIQMLLQDCHRQQRT